MPSRHKKARLVIDLSPREIRLFDAMIHHHVEVSDDKPVRDLAIRLLNHLKLATNVVKQVRMKT
jgi:hypothetical protein